MSYTVVGACPRCGAPIYSASFYHSVLPPPPIYTCACFAIQAATVTVTSTMPVDGKPLSIQHEPVKKSVCIWCGYSWPWSPADTWIVPGFDGTVCGDCWRDRQDRIAKRRETR